MCTQSPFGGGQKQPLFACPRCRIDGEAKAAHRPDLVAVDCYSACAVHVHCQKRICSAALSQQRGGAPIHETLAQRAVQRVREAILQRAGAG